MRRAASIIAFALVACAGLLTLAFVASGDERRVAFSLGVQDYGQVATLASGQVGCERDIVSQVAFGGITVWIAPPAATPGSPIDITVRADATGAPVATGRLPRRYTSAGTYSASLSGTIPAGRTVSVCLRDAGPAAVGLIGGVTGENLFIDGRRTGADLSMLLLRTHPASLLSLLPTVFRRAALFRPGWVGTWTFWLLSGLLLAAFPVCALALGAAVRADASETGEPSPLPSEDRAVDREEA